MEERDKTCRKKEDRRICRVALTGGAGSGKSSVAAYLEERGLFVIHADLLAREVVAVGAPGYVAIVEHFGKAVVLDDGRLDRRALRGMITLDAGAKEAVEKVVQPEIISLMEKRIGEAEAAGEPVVVVELPLLFELGLEPQFDRVLIISVERKIQIRRLLERDGVSEEKARALLSIQFTEEDRCARGGYVIKNNGSLEETLKAVDKWYDCCLKV